VSKTPRTDEFFYERTIKPSTRAWLKYARIIESELTDAAAELRRLHSVNAELLEALNDVTQEAESYVEYGWDRTDESAELRLAIARARATVAKTEAQ
jgi:hypothetical protein